MGIIMYEKLADEIIAGRRLDRAEDLSFLTGGDLEELKSQADRIRVALCGNHADLCTIINGRAGRCSEDCRFCAQSAHHHTDAQEYTILDEDELLRACRESQERGVRRFSVVTAGRTLSGEDFDRMIRAYQRMRAECGKICLCASHGLLTEEQFERLRESGVTMYHANIETSERYFPDICTTHSFADKLTCIRRAKKAGLTVCSGGIIGMGESWEDRLDMAFTLAEYGVDSIPLNALIPIRGTPLGEMPVLTEDEIIRTVVLFRFINPTAYIRLAAGRKLMKDSGREAFFAGANAAITGDMLTTSGNNIDEDRRMLAESGFAL